MSQNRRHAWSKLLKLEYNVFVVGLLILAFYLLHKTTLLLRLYNATNVSVQLTSCLKKPVKKVHQHREQ